MKYIVIMFWSVLCMIAGIKGFKGELAAFYAGLGWTILGIVGIVFTYACYRIEKMFKEFVLRCEEIEEAYGNKTDGRD